MAQPQRGGEKITTIGQLRDGGAIDKATAQALGPVVDKYAVAITPAIKSMMANEGFDGPVSAQFLPSEQELITTPRELSDPIGDRDHSPVRGIVHRYPDRVLFKIVATCPAYCRFCFRRAMIGPASGDVLSQDDIAGALAYIAQTPRIWEVIFSGGDPLILSPRKIAWLMDQLADAEHVKVIRWHTRVPAIAPDMITAALIAALTQTDKAVFVAIHSNHSNEHTKQMRKACRELIDAGITLVSQTVLLKGVNDSVAELASLMKSFVEIGVKPYYLHQLDLAPGTSHFRVPLHEARDLVVRLRGQLSGLCQPTFMLDIPGGHGKAVAAQEELKQDDELAYTVRDYRGGSHTYKEVLNEPGSAE